MKKLILSLIVAAPLSVFATGLSFQTLAPTVGDIFQSDESIFATTASIDFGITAYDAAGAAGKDFATIQSEFTSSVSSNFDGAGNVTGAISAGVLAAGAHVWAIIDEADEYGAFYLGSTPSLGVLASNPQVATAVIGTKVGNNLYTVAVPEPSTAGLLAGLLALGSVMLRRRAA
jgi:hypothetical protein